MILYCCIEIAMMTLYEYSISVNLYVRWCQSMSEVELGESSGTRMSSGNKTSSSRVCMMASRWYDFMIA
jgi:hypothetical protein